MIVGNIQVGLTGARCCMTAPVTAGLMGAKLEIRYTHPAWQDLGRLVTFQGGKVSRSVREEDGTVTIPWEVLQKPGTGLTVGITGTDAEDHVVIPTVPLVLCRILPGTQPGEEAAGDPTLPVWAQLDDRLRKVEEEDARKLADALEEAKESGAFQGEAARVTGFRVDYQAWDSGTRVPQGSWQDTPPQVRQGQYLWTRSTLHFNTGDPVVSYSVARMGMDGMGSVTSVGGISPDASGNVPLTARAIGAGSPRNLLDNSDFRNPVMQAGLNGYHGGCKFPLDRWISWDMDITLADGYITVGTPIDQRLSRDVIDVDKLYTVAICFADGEIRSHCSTFGHGRDSEGIGSYNMGVYCYTPLDNDNQEDSYVVVRLAAGNSVKWVALYEGEYTADTLPEYQPKGYRAELAECQRYYIDLSGTHAYGVVTEKGTAEIVIPLPVSLRLPYPSFTFNGSLWAYKGSGGTILLNVSGAAANSVSIRFFCTSETAENVAIVVPDIACTISADL